MVNVDFGNIDGNKVLADIATDVIKEALAASWGKIKKFFKDLDAKDAILYGTAYTKYLSNTMDKNGKIKTLI